ncbi:MAG: CoA transferase [Chloroflexota bacterium]|nr:CoA transferase [Chloroflexota bacterium]
MGTTSAELPLAALRVLDLADDSGALCGRVLADLGADVVKVEPPEGDPGRRVPPFAGDSPEPERSLSWLAANVNKRGITCNLRTETGRVLFRKLASTADVVVETFPPGHLATLGLAYEALASLNSRLILTSIMPFGGSGPLSAYAASDLEITAASGSLWLAGDGAHPPVRTTLPQTPAWSGMHAAAGTLMALLAREATGVGQQVDVSGQASMIAAISHAPVFWDLLGEEQLRSGPYLTGRSVTGAHFRTIWPCRDGHVAFALYGGPAGRQTSQALVSWMEERGGAAPDVLKRVDWDSFDIATVTPAQAQAIEAEIGPFLLGLSREEFFKGVVARNMLGYPVATVEDIRKDEQLAARDFWQQVDLPWGGGADFPGSFGLFAGRRPPIRRTAPRLGEHNLEVYVDELGLTAAELTTLRGAGAI